MKNLIILFLVGPIIFFLGYFLDRNSVPQIQINEDNISALSKREIKLPNFQFKTLANKDYFIHDFKGKIVLLNFWASWCAPCLEEFPEILKVLQEGEKKIVLVAISNDRSKANIKKFIMKFQKKWGPLLSQVIIGLDPKRELSSSLNILRLPETFVLNRRGAIIRKIVGANQWRDGKLRDYFRELKGLGGQLKSQKK